MAVRKQIPLLALLNKDDIICAINFWLKQPDIDMVDRKGWEKLSELLETRGKVATVEQLQVQWLTNIQDRLNEFCKTHKQRTHVDIPPRSNKLAIRKLRLKGAGIYLSEVRMQMAICYKRFTIPVEAPSPSLAGEVPMESPAKPSAPPEYNLSYLLEKYSLPGGQQEQNSNQDMEEGSKKETKNNPGNTLASKAVDKRAGVTLEHKSEIAEPSKKKARFSLLNFIMDGGDFEKQEFVGNGYKLPPQHFQGINFYVLQKPGDWADATAALSHEFYIKLHGGNVLDEEPFPADTIVIGSSDEDYSKQESARLWPLVFRPTALREIVQKQNGRTEKLDARSFRKDKYIILEDKADSDEYMDISEDEDSGEIAEEISEQGMNLSSNGEGRPCRMPNANETTIHEDNNEEEKVGNDLDETLAIDETETVKERSEEDQKKEEKEEEVEIVDFRHLVDFNNGKRKINPTEPVKVVLPPDAEQKMDEWIANNITNAQTDIHSFQLTPEPSTSNDDDRKTTVNIQEEKTKQKIKDDAEIIMKQKQDLLAAKAKQKADADAAKLKKEKKFQQEQVYLLAFQMATSSYKSRAKFIHAVYEKYNSIYSPEIECEHTVKNWLNKFTTAAEKIFQDIVSKDTSIILTTDMLREVCRMFNYSSNEDAKA